ncbi:MAG: hypothetical protein HYV53_03925 [Parcubacteria group bacterium]|nr:hypothetical protein [Parcubacteria group bacterium]
MLAYLEKFNKLPAVVRSQVSDSRALAIIEELEKKYKVALAALIMKIMVGEIALNQLAENLLKENLSESQANELARALKQNIFSSAMVKPASAAAIAVPSISQPKVKGANFFFSPDDEEEIRQLTKKIVMAENLSLAPAVIDDKLTEIISRAQINFGSAGLAERFSQILRTYLRGIRNKLDVKAALMKPFLNGGLNFDEDSAQKVMLLADKVVHPVKSQSEIGTQSVFNGVNSVPGLPAMPAQAGQAGQPIKPLPKISLPELEKSEISRDAAYDFSKLATKDNKLKNDLKKLDVSRELAPLTPAVLPAQAGASAAPAPKKTPQAQEKVPLKSDAGARPLIKRRFEAENLNQSQKVKIEDVKYVPRVMGPLDELKYLDLISFRRLDPDSLKSADKIKSKINLLAEKDYGKKLEGIKLWRLSPINKLYLAIGHLSISENKPVDVIIEERKARGEEYLSSEEFKAIMDLNKSLRF